MTEIPNQMPEDIESKHVLVDEYHPLSLDWDENWELVRKADNSWVARRKSEGEAIFGRERNPQTGCG